MTGTEINDAEFARGVKAGRNWWRVSKTTRAVAAQRFYEVETETVEAIRSGDTMRASYLLGMQHTLGKVSGVED